MFNEMASGSSWKDNKTSTLKFPPKCHLLLSCSFSREMSRNEATPVPVSSFVCKTLKLRCEFFSLSPSQSLIFWALGPGQKKEASMLRKQNEPPATLAHTLQLAGAIF